MKKLLSLIALFFAANTFAQAVKNAPIEVKENIEEPVFQVVEIIAEFPGGVKAWTKFLQNNLKADVAANNGAPVGKYFVLVSFIVNKDGTLNNFTIEKNAGFGTGEEVVRLMKTSPKWKPAVQNGRVVSAVFRQPVTFAVSKG
jgi:periplasmic protein TonB